MKRIKGDTVPCVVTINGDKPHKTIKFIRELNNTELLEFKRCADRLLEFSNDNQILKIFILNHANYFSLAKSFDKEHQSGSINPLRYDDINAHINMAILNFVTSIRMFLDHSETKLKRRYGKNSLQVEDYQKLTNKLFDDNFSYRFFYKFRNYTQHCGMPTLEIGLFSNIIDINKPRNVERNFLIRLVRDELLDNFDSWGSVRDDLEALQEKFSIDEYMDEMHKHLQTLKNKIISFEIEELKSCMSFLMKLYENIDTKVDTPSVMVFPKEKEEDDKGQIPLVQYDFHLHTIDHINSIIEKGEYVAQFYG